MVLRHLLCWLKADGRFSLEVLLKSGGPLESDFATLAPTTVLRLARHEHWARRICNRLERKIPAGFTLSFKALQFARDRGFDLIYANTVVVSEEVEALAKLGLPIVWHIHELPFGIQSHGGGRPFLNARWFARTFIPCSVRVQQALGETYSIPAKKMKLVHEFVVPADDPAVVVARHREAIRKELGMPSNAFVIGMCGGVIWRKGPDLFVNLARHLVTEFPGKIIRLLWIGGWENARMQSQIEHDLRMADLADRVRFVGAKANSLAYLAALDVFALVSREDPFPLTMLEAAALGLPVVCFDRTGGGPEFVGDDAGIVVGYGDTLAMARALGELSGQPARREQLGAAARLKVMQRFTVDIQAPKILRVIEEALETAIEPMPAPGMAAGVG
jgi:glycosyltransferase involved in cell wall biosynthesis